MENLSIVGCFILYFVIFVKKGSPYYLMRYEIPSFVPQIDKIPDNQTADQIDNRRHSTDVPVFGNRKLSGDSV